VLRARAEAVEVRLAGRVEAGELLELRRGDGGRDRGNPVAPHAPAGGERLDLLQRHLLAQPRDVMARHGGPLVVALPVGHQEASLAGDDRLGALEAEGPDLADCPAEPALVPRAVGVGDVLDHRQPPRGGGPHDLVHVGRQAPQVRRDDRPGVCRRLAGDLARVDVEGPRRRVAQDGRAAGVQDGRDRGDPVVGAGEHLRARAYADGEQGRVNGRRARGERQAVPAAEELRVGVFHGPDEGPAAAVAQATRQNHFRGGVDLAVVDHRVGRPGKAHCLGPVQQGQLGPLRHVRTPRYVSLLRIVSSDLPPAKGPLAGPAADCPWLRPPNGRSLSAPAARP